MLDSRRVSEFTERAFRKHVPQADLERVVAEPATDSEGNEALRITLVLKPDSAGELTGDQALDLLVAIQQTLRAEGEERFPIVQYATEQELDPEDTEGPEPG
jgi:hypothetical protein